jgi:hypothetical protein
MTRALLGLLGLFVAAPAGAEEGHWAILPARAETPPPRDPTLVRISGQIGEAIADAMDAKVELLSREIRDEACPAFDGVCPRDVASLVNADHVVSLVLKADYSSMEVRLYDHRAGLMKQGQIPCKWSAGFASCESAGIQKLFAPKAAAAEPADPPPPPAEKTAAAPTKAPPPPKGKRGHAKAAEEAPAPPPSPAPAAGVIDDPTIARAAKILKRKFAKCTKHGWGEVPVKERPASMEIRFRISAEGKAREVRVEPPGFDDVPAFACMARILESLKVDPSTSKEGSYRLPLPHP